MISTNDIIKINRQFDKGEVINENSLEFALSNQKETEDWIKQVAYLVRAILIDHVFEEGNKRTASALIMAALGTQKIGYDPQKVNEAIIEILKKNINNIEKIRRLIKNVTR